jgi:nitrogen fixation NifU-like protein
MYSDLVMEHFFNPRNVGMLTHPDGVGTIGDPDCGDYLRIYIKVWGDRLVDIKYQVYGCPAAIATGSILTEMAKGKTLDEALKITDKDVAVAIGGLPDNKMHCSNLGASALHEAINNYRSGLKSIG